MKVVPVALTTAFAALTAVVTAVTAHATPLSLETPDPHTASQTDSQGSDQPLLSCPPVPDADDPMAAIPPRDPLCGENDMELTGDIFLRSNAYRRLSTIYGPDVAVSIIGNNHYQLRDHAGNLILGEDRSTLHHVPFGREIPPPLPGNAADLTPHEQAIREGISRVTVGIMQGVVYTGDLTDMSAYLTTPIGSLIVQAPGTGPDPLQPGPGGERELQLLNNFQALDAQGRYVMGNTLTLGSPMALWPNAAVPCPLGTVPISELPSRADVMKSGKPLSAADLPDPVCKAPASVPITGFIDDQPDQAAPPPGPKPQSDPVQRQKDINDAYSAVGTQFGLAVALGAVLGGAAGLAFGCLAGGVGGAIDGSLSASIPGAAGGGLAGCLAGATIFGSIGGTVGSLAIGVPVGIISGVNAYNTLRLQGDVARKPITEPAQQQPARTSPLVTAGVPAELAAAVPPELVPALSALVAPSNPQLAADLSAPAEPPIIASGGLTELAAAVAPMIANAVPTLFGPPAQTA